MRSRLSEENCAATELLSLCDASSCKIPGESRRWMQRAGDRIDRFVRGDDRPQPGGIDGQCFPADLVLKCIARFAQQLDEVFETVGCRLSKHARLKFDHHLWPELF